MRNINSFHDLDRALLLQMLDNEQQILAYIRGHESGVCDHCRRLHLHHPDNMSRDHPFYRR